MPSRNIVKEFADGQYYHLYNRGVEKREIFQDTQDYKVFLGLLRKYLTGENRNKNNRHPIKYLGDDVQLLAYCLMPNHYHLLLYQAQASGVTELLRRVSTGYVMYFNKKYGRVGSLFQGIYKASLVDKDEYLHHVSRYIHLNPKDYKNWQYSSVEYYAGNKKAVWLKDEPILELFENNRKTYFDFLDNYQEHKEELDSLRWQLANGADLEM